MAQIDFGSTEVGQQPWIGILLNVFGWLAVLGGALALFAGLEDRLDSEIAMGIGSVLGGLLLLGIAFALHKLRQIESHLRRRD